jgi:NADPH:quinone reductase-like Zn-dependent oxidoreductase/acyl carrier protein
VEARCPDRLSADDLYGRSKPSGLQYGPAFRGIVEARVADHEALARVRAPEGVVRSLVDYRFHPALFDACFQAIVCPASVSPGTTYLPITVECVTVGARPGEWVQSHARVTHIGGDRLRATLHVLDAGGAPIAVVEGLECQAMEARTAAEPLSLSSLLYAYSWQRKRRDDPVAAVPRPVRRPALHELVTDAQQSLKRFAVGPPLPDLDDLCSAYLANSVVELGWPIGTGAFTTGDACRALGIPDDLDPVMSGVLDLLAARGSLKRVRDGWQFSRPPRYRPTQALWRSLVQRAPGLLAELTVLHRGGSRLPQLLRGELTAAEAICPRDDDSVLQHLYEDSLPLRPAHLTAQDLLGKAIASRTIERPFRVLELTGARRAGSIASPFVSAGEVECLTESPGGAWTEAEAGSFDVVVSRCVLCSAKAPDALLAHAARVVGDSGLFLAIEPTSAPAWWRFVLGLAELACAETMALDRRPFGGTPAPWSDVLQRAGWTAVPCGSAPDAGRGSQEPRCGVTIAERSVRPEPPRQQPEAIHVRTDVAQGTWLIFADTAGYASRLAHILERLNQQCVLVTPGSSFRTPGPSRIEIDPASGDDVARLVTHICTNTRGPSLRGIVHLWPLDAAFDAAPETRSPESRLDVTSLNVVLVAQALMARSDGETPRLWVVTSGAHTPGAGADLVCPFQSAIWAIGRTLANEFPQSRCTLVDLGRRGAAGEADADLRALADELLWPDAEDEIALRGGERYVHRLGRVPPAPISPRRSGPATRGFRLGVGQKRDLDGLTLAQCTRTAPAPGEVEVRIEAAGLNFSDVLNALGLYPGLGPGPVPLGLECSGVVTRVGRRVATFAAGDRVMALAPFSFADHVTMPAHLVAAIPGWLTCFDAATIPVAFVTAYYALVTRGGLRRGERVLIHSASGGVGLAAIQIARRVGAEVFATAGTPEKREFLAQVGVTHVMDSRSLAFAREVMTITDGEGVDLVLNSLAGEAIPKGLSVLRDHGRFLEIGKRDIYEDHRIGLWPFRKNLSFLAIDLDKVMREQPKVAGGILSTVARLVRQRRFVPLPYRVFPLAGARSAWRTMAKATHMGKIVVSVGDHAPCVEAAPAARPRFRSEATYLITGGFGGLGLLVARWLADHGARHLALVGRHGAASHEARAAVAQLERTGVSVAQFHADVSRQQDVARVIGTIGRRMPSLRGVIHAAAVLDDALVANLNGERLRRVAAPKAFGAWYLHGLTKGLPLDFFLLFSSVSSVVGMPGQCNYAGANGFLDGLSAHRRALGLPSITINWGYVGELGLAARNPDVVARFENQGLKPISPAESLDVLGWFLAERPVQMTALKMDWGRFGKVFGLFGQAPKFAPLYREGASRHATASDADRAQRGRSLDGLPEVERASLVRSLLHDQIARVLGTSAGRLDVHTPLTDLGFDSLMAVELRNWLDSAFAVGLPAVEVMRGPSVEQLAAAVLQRLARTGGAERAPGPS